MQPSNVHYLGKGKDCATLIAAWCKARWPEVIPADHIFCVPTSLAGRRLNDALINEYGTFQGVSFITPTRLFDYFEAPLLTGKTALATPTEQLQAWLEVFAWLQENDPKSEISKHLFPNANRVFNNASSGIAVAKQLMSMRTAIFENLLDFSGVYTYAKTHNIEEHECTRWQALEAFEAKYRDILREHDLIDPIDSQIAMLKLSTLHPQVEGITRLIFACVPDFIPCLTRLLDALPACDILIHADEGQAEGFDNYGRPSPAYWANEDRALAVNTNSIEAVANPSEVAYAVEQFIRRKQILSIDQICLGILDNNAAPALISNLASHEISVFKPDPLVLSEQPCVRLLLQVIKLSQEDSQYNIRALVDSVELQKVCSPNSDYCEFREAYNKLITAHLPQTLSQSIHFADDTLKPFLLKCAEWVQALKTDPLKGTRIFLSDVYGSRTVNQSTEPELFATMHAVRNLLNELETSRFKTPISIALFQRRLGDTSFNPDREDAHSAIEGRFELLWSSAPYMTLAGVNETIFPDSTFDDTFLPNTFRRELGLRSDQERIARDAYILDTLASRYNEEALQIIVLKSNRRGDLLKPSRLLFRCDEKALYQRVAALFAETKQRTDAIAQNPSDRLAALHSGLKLPPPSTWRESFTIPSTLSASSINTFVESPTYFLLRYVYHLKEVNPPADSVDAINFGIICHEVLKNIKDCPDEKLRGTLARALETSFETKYGNNLSLELLASREAIRNRLNAFCDFEEQSRKEGWKTISTETDFSFRRGDFEIKGRIDRIDYNAEADAYRVIDYKTGTPPTYYKEKAGEWVDFQLPIYLLAIQTLYPSIQSATALYLPLPKDGKVEIKKDKCDKYLKDPDSYTNALDDTLAKIKNCVNALDTNTLPYHASLLLKLLPKE